MIGLRSWRQNRTSEEINNDITSLQVTVQDAFQNQTKIGRGQLTRGNVSNKWVQIV